MSWDAEFDEPVPPPHKKQARTLREAADYVMKLPRTEQDLPEWRAAVSPLMVVAEHKGPPMFARMGLMQALNRGKPPAAPSERKDTPWAGDR